MPHNSTNGQLQDTSLPRSEPLTISEPHLHRLVLDNGITLIIVENQAADIISGRFFQRCRNYCRTSRSRRTRSFSLRCNY